MAWAYRLCLLAPSVFYKGFYKGLSTREKPIQLMTFNVEFNAHKRWLEEHDIFVNHSCVLLLSKIINEGSFELVREILRHHSGIWFNKFQRLAEEFNLGVWLEWSPLPEPQRFEFCDFTRTSE